MTEPVTKSGKRFTAFAILAAWLTLPAWVGLVKPGDYTPAIQGGQKAAFVQSNSAAARLFGQFRTGLGDIFFVKTDEALHGGIRYYIPQKTTPAPGETPPPPEHEDQGTTESVDHEDDHCALEEAGAVTVIPPPEKDWRGFIGDLERVVNPWAPPGAAHRHTEGERILPLYRLATLANPNHIRAWRAGCYQLMDIGDKELGLREALKFVEEGIGHNPDSLILYRTKGAVLRKMGRQDEALKAFREAIRLGVEQRPKQGTTPGVWDDDKEEELEWAVRYTAYILSEKGKDAEALNLIKNAGNFIGGSEPFDSLEKMLEAHMEGKN